MAEKVIINKSILTDIGNAIREKEESSDLIPSTEMATRIRDFQGGAKIISGGKSAVPVDGTTVVDTIFSDTSKSIEEVDAILSQLTYIDGLLGAGVGSYILFYGTSGYGDNIILVNKITNPFGDGKDIYTIQTSDSSYLFYQNYDTDGNTFGWVIEDIPNGLRAGAPEFKINMASTTEIQGMPVGAQNELLKDIIYVGSAGVEKILKGEYNGDSVSITKPENVNISALIDEQKIPLAVNVDIPTYDGGYENGTQVDRLKKLLDATKSCYGLFHNFKGNIDELISYDDTENVEDMSNMFETYKNSTYPSLNMKNVTKVERMFQNSCVTTISELSLINCKSLYCFASNCSFLTTISNLETSNVTNFYSAFSSCSNLAIVSGINMISGTSAAGMLSNATKLTDLILYNIKTNLQIGSGDGTGSYDFGTLLTLDSLINTIRELVNVNKSKTLTMGSANLAKIENVYVRLTGEAEEDESNPKLPCEVCESTDEGAMTIIAYANSKNWTIA